MHLYDWVIKKIAGLLHSAARGRPAPKVEQLEPRVLLSGAELLWSTYVGNESDDFVYGIATDSQGYIYALGEDCAITGYAPDGQPYIQDRVVLTKIKPDGSGVVWTQYVLNGYGNRVAVDGNDNIYITGCVEIPDDNEGSKGLVAKFDSNGNMIWQAYIGGANYEETYGIAIDKDGNILVCGETQSSGWITNGWDKTYGGAEDDTGDGFVAKLSPDGQQVLWASYIGGKGGDSANAIAVDADGNAYVVGLTSSSGWTSGGFDTSYKGGSIAGYPPYDGFLIKFDANGNHLWSTYIGDSYPDAVFDVAIDGSGNPVIVGACGPIGWIKGGYDTSFAGNSTKEPDAFAAKIHKDGSKVLWGTYIGGSNFDWAHGVAINSSGDIFVWGSTQSSGWVKDGFDTTYNGNGDAFILALTSDGSHLWSSYLGGNQAEEAYTVAIDHDDNILVAGQTESSGWVSGGYDTSYAGATIGADPEEDISGDGFVAKIHQLPLNHAPTLTSIETLTGASQDWPYQISYEALLAASDAQDPDGDPIQFQLDSVSSGTLKDAQGNKLSAGARLGEGQTWTWQPPAGKNGLLNAFKVKASDGESTSGSAVQVKIDVAPIPDLQPTAVDSSVWQSAQIHDDVTWSVTVANNGPVDQTAQWTVEWYLSSDNKIGATDILIGSDTYDDDISSKGTIDKTLVAKVPAIPKAGQYYVIARLVNTGPDSKASNDKKAGTDKDWFGSVDPDSYEDQDQEENDSRESATDLGYVAGTKAYTGLTIHQSGNEDWYQFTTCRQGTTKVQIDFTNTEGDLALALFDQDGIQLAPTSDKTGNSEKVSINNLPEGQYYIKVWSSHGDVSRNYKLTIIAPSGPDLQITKVDSNVWQSAQIDDDIAWTATIKNNGPGNQRAPWQLEWYLSTDNKLGSTDTLIGSQVYDDDIEAKGTIDKTFDAKVPAIPAGQYYIIAKVTTTGPETNTKNNTKASTDRDWFGSVDPDSYEDNDSMDAAWDLGSSKVTLDNLTIDDGQDEDWYSFELTRPGTSSNKVQIDFTNAEGDLDIELYDSAGNLLKGAYTAANSHQISLNKLAAGKYYVRILAHQQDGYLPDVCRKYKLTLVI